MGAVSDLEEYVDERGGWTNLLQAGDTLVELGVATVVGGVDGVLGMVISGHAQEFPWLMYTPGIRSGSGA